MIVLNRIVTGKGDNVIRRLFESNLQPENTFWLCLNTAISRLQRNFEVDFSRVEGSHDDQIIFRGYHRANGGSFFEKVFSRPEKH